MARLFPELIFEAGVRRTERTALIDAHGEVTYGGLAEQVERIGAGFRAVGLAPRGRVGVYLDKRIETVAAFFGAAHAGGAFVPINPVLKARQVHHILADCAVQVLVTAPERLESLREVLGDLPNLRTVILVGDGEAPEIAADVLRWDDFLNAAEATGAPPRRVMEDDMAAIFYTSGSTGLPKGVVISHRNLVVGAESVAGYLENTPEDRILSLLPLSFDAGFSQITTAAHAGAALVLHNYLLPNEVPRLCAKHGITGLTGVPPLWFQILRARWTPEAAQSLRYFANTGGRMPRATLESLRRTFPNAKPFLMYGLTEAFRSTYLDPAEVDRRPDSIGKAIPNAEVLVVKPTGELAGPGEQGELVHRGPLVSLGYWNDAARTAERFKPAPARPEEIQVPEFAVWSGDIVRIDEEGFLYFIGRGDDMIKTSGYRVSPTEVEEAVYETGLVSEVAALGVADDQLGQAIVLALVAKEGEALDTAAVLHHCREVLAAYMVPRRAVEMDSLPRSPNGKLDRPAIAERLDREQATARAQAS